MKASDLVTTSEQKVLAGERLLFTEQTDAVNTGLVNSADKSGSVLKDRQLPTGGPSSTGRRPPMADGPQPPRGRRDPAGGWRTVSDGQAKNPNAPDASLTAQTHRHMAAAMGKRTAATAAGAVVHNTLQDTELDDADNLYYETKGTVSGAKAVYRAIRKRLGASPQPTGTRAASRGVDGVLRDGPHGPANSRRTIPTQGNPLGGLSEKKYLNRAADPAAVKRRAQAAGYVKRRTYQAAAKNAAAAASKTAAAHSATTAGLKGAAGGGLKAVAGAFGGLLAPLLGILLVVVFIAVLGGASGSSTQQQNQVSLNGLSGVQLEVATALSQAGYGPVQIASIMGNIQGESGWDPTVGDASSGYGLYQFTGSSYTAFANWCDANGKQKDSATAQTEYIASNLQGLWGTALHNSGYYGAITDYAGKDVSYEAWQSSTDVGFATYAFMACYERPRSDVAPSSFTEDRLPAAQQFYALLTGGAGGLGEDYANADETGKAIVNAALVTPWPGADLCATWVSHVYQQAGLGYPTGNGNSILAGYATSSDWANIKVGQIISAQYGSGSAGAIYGHTGIYIGDGKVMDSISSGIRTSSLTDWIAENGRGWVVYGWPW